MTKTAGVLLNGIVLKNGLEVFFYDQSKPVAGDRCMVQLLIDIPIPIDPALNRGSSVLGVTFHEFREHFGSVLHYQIVKTRNFVPRHELESILSELRREFTETQFHYLQHAAFAHSFVLKTYEEWCKKRQYTRAHAAAVKQAESREQ